MRVGNRRRRCGLCGSVSEGSNPAGLRAIPLTRATSAWRYALGVSAATIGSAALWGAIAIGAATLIPNPRTARPLLGVSALLAAISTLTLAAALIAGDFSLAYVVDTTSRATPWPYRMAALWGGMDGSMLFYSALTLGVGWIAARRIDLGGIGMRVVAMAGVGYLLVTAFIANPFDVLAVPALDGVGLLAILQHPAMVYHPPILYLGLTVLVIPAALTLEAVLEKRTDRIWLRTTRRWLVVSWTLLTLGMAAGANWAYIELGWGGFWAWDPVENTSLMPWLAAAIFLHTSRVEVQTGRLRRWNVFFALTAFVLTILGVYLTRSGVTGSIHAFAEDPVIGRVLLSATLVAIVGAIYVAWRAPKGEPWTSVGSGRDTWLLAAGVLIAVILLFVAIGSAYPAYASVFLDESLSIDAGFFVTTIYPIALLLAVLMPFALSTRWKRAGLSLGSVGIFIGTSAAVAILVVSLAINPTWVGGGLLAPALAGTMVLTWFSVSRRPRGRRLAGYLAHLGVLMVLTGAAGSAMGDQFVGVLAPGDTVEVGGHHVAMIDIDTGETDRFLFAEARIEVDGDLILTPQIRAYEDQALPVAEPALHSTPASDVIVAISLLFPEANAADVSVFVRPLVWWVWAGSLLLTLAGLLWLHATAGDVSGRRRLARAVPPAEGTTSDNSAR